MPTDHPILFTGAMVRAILDRRKTQTRRVVKWPIGDPHADFDDDGWPIVEDEHDDWHRLPCPYGGPGDLLWVREAWRPFTGQTPAEPGCVIDYKATGCDRSAVRWRPSIHMPKWACRLWLEVVDVRVQRVQEISPADCKAEGVQKQLTGTSAQLRTDFRDLWNSINARRGYGWDVNPWVWVVTFERRVER